MTTLGGRICMENKGSCCWSVPVVCALLPGFPSQPTQVQWAAAARRPWGGGDGGEPRVEILLIVLRFMAEMP